MLFSPQQTKYMGVIITICGVGIVILQSISVIIAWINNTPITGEVFDVTSFFGGLVVAAVGVAIIRGGL